MLRKKLCNHSGPYSKMRCAKNYAIIQVRIAEISSVPMILQN